MLKESATNVALIGGMKNPLDGILFNASCWASRISASRTGTMLVPISCAKGFAETPPTIKLGLENIFSQTWSYTTWLMIKLTFPPFCSAQGLLVCGPTGVIPSQ
ncbi:hypothetical protein D9M68_230350 [compost metagenome]